ncbi:MAG: RHS repeat protein, partial [Thermoanaerobaculia bacterium]|nr:RHS repeat protein [Thermoanaerobaculia bacterium]
LVTESIAQTDGRRSTTLPDGTTIETMLGPDPRFGMAAPITKSVRVRTPSGLERTETFERRVTLANPSDLLSLTRQEDLWTVAGKTTTQVYDAATRRLTTTSPEGRQWEVEMDEEGRLISGRLGDLELVRVEYDTDGKPAAIRQGTDENERALLFDFDPPGQLATFSDSLAHSVRLEQDATGQIVRQVLPSGREMRTSYDAKGNPTTVTPSDRSAHTFSYTPTDVVATYTPPAVAGAGATTYTYDLDRQLKRLDRPDGQAVQLDFDMAGQLGTVTHAEGAFSVAYDPGTGQPQMLTAPGSTLIFSHAGVLVTGMTWSGTVSGGVGWSYDTELRVATEHVNGGLPVTWQYDRDDLPIRVGDLAITRDAETGFENETTLGSVSTQRSFNSFGEMVGIEASIVGMTIYQLLLDRDKTGRITTKTETVGGETHRLDYGYDLDGRLVRVERDGLAWSEYGYDANGNRLTYRGVLGDANGLYDDQDRLLQYGDKSYGYSAAGELQTKIQGAQALHFGYDVLGSLKTVLLADGINVEYVTDALDRRIGKKSTARWCKVCSMPMSSSPSLSWMAQGTSWRDSSTERAQSCPTIW